MLPDGNDIPDGIADILKPHWRLTEEEQEMMDSAKEYHDRARHYHEIANHRMMKECLKLMDATRNAFISSVEARLFEVWATAETAKGRPESERIFGNFVEECGLVRPWSPLLTSPSWPGLPR